MHPKIKEEEQNILKLLSTLKLNLARERSRWEGKWQDIRRYGFPYYGDDLTDDDDGDILDDDLINDYPSECLDTYVAGMQGGTCSATAKWFTVGINSPSEDSSHGISVYLDNINSIILFWLGLSNFYEAKREQIAEMAVFGSGPILIEEGDVFSSYTFEQSDGDESPFYFIPLSCGSYYLKKNKKGDVDTLIREFTLDAQGMLETFGEDTPEEIRKQAKKFELGGQHTITQVIIPREKFDMQLPVKDEFTFLSFYYLEGLRSVGVDIATLAGKSKGGLLRVSGYYEQPFACPQEKPKNGSSYSHSIGEFVRGNVKGLQMLEDDSYELLEKLVDPSLQGPAEKSNVEIFTEAGSYNPYPDDTGENPIRPVYEPSPHASTAIDNKITVLEERIRKRLCVDLFFAVTEKAQNIKTAYQTSVIDSERFTKLIPSIERLARTDAVLLKRIFNILQRNGWLTQAPQELDGFDIDFNFDSPITQTQKLKKLPPIEQYIQFLANVAAFEAGAGKQPTAADNLDVDEVVAEYGDTIHVSPKVIRSKNEVAQLRQSRAKDIEQQKAEAALSQLPDQARALSQTQINNGSALDALMGGSMEGVNA